MNRNIPADLLARMSSSGTTLCQILKIIPVADGVDPFGLCSTDKDVPFDNGDGVITYRAATGWAPTDQDATNTLSVDNGEAQSLIYPLDGVTVNGINRGDYDGARYRAYLIDYENPSAGGSLLHFGFVGSIKLRDELSCDIQLRSLTQVLKQNSVIELTSITCRAAFGDERCKLPLIWHNGQVITVGDESDRTFSTNVDALATSPDDLQSEDSNGNLSYPDGYFSPGVLKWITGLNAGREYDIETYIDGVVTLLLPTFFTISPTDTFMIRRDCDKSKAMCQAYGNLVNMRAEPDLPRADGLDLQAPGIGGDTITGTLDNTNVA